MRQPVAAVVALAAVSVLFLGAARDDARQATPSAAQQWPQWRGPLGTGEAPAARPPLQWSAEKNVRWRTELPGEGKSTPVVWGDAIYVTTAVPVGPAPGSVQPQRDSARGVEHKYAFTVLAIDRATGRVRWQRTVREEVPHEGTHRDGTFASPSVVTDGRRIYAFFGSRGLHALDLNGRVLWSKDLGRMQTRLGFGEGASPALHGDTLVVAWDHEGDDFILGLDAATGAERWRRQRDEPTTWTTPHVVQHGGAAQVIVAGTNRVSSYDLRTGDTVWEAPGLTTNVIPSVVSGDGLVFAMSGFRGNAARAIRLAEAKGTITGPPAVAWSYDRDTPYVPSPLLYRGGLYFLKSNSGVLTQLDARTGEVRYTERLSIPNVYSSPVAADGRVYVTGREGETVVLEAGPAPKVLATNPLPDAVDASLALVDSEIYLRGAKHLYRISE